ncbi:hypothetical protein D8I35_04120 [Corticibacter populi]|uniref:Phasin family protein n=1 Tax=Corticibacter populi TaxID=1550736 RepID=A0A3M6QZ58_9BURK|nr:hypothetical protein [Corticibacter populi]RMX08297.1 hypothetical protein D8I35_04120 [Corticibacter populi]RZS35579.1 hypothetical protein EV687_0651 [Corticibacter populi]
MSAPFDFYKASLELWSKISKDVQAGSQQWLEEAARLANEDMKQTNEQLQQLVKDQNWVALAGLPQEAAWRTYTHQLAAWQTVVQELAQHQPDFNTGIQKTVSGWQEDALKSFNQAFGAFQQPELVQKFFQPLTAAADAAKAAESKAKKGD